MNNLKISKTVTPDKFLDYNSWIQNIIKEKKEAEIRIANLTVKQNS